MKKIRYEEKKCGAALVPPPQDAKGGDTYTYIYVSEHSRAIRISLLSASRMSETLGDISVPLQLRTEGSGSGNLANCQDYVDQKQTEMLKELPSSLIKCPTNRDGQAHPVVEVGISEVEYVESENLKDVDDVDLTLEEMDDHEEVGVYTLTHPTGGEFKLETHVYERLLQHERFGLDWLWYIHCHLSGGILCDDRGTGKTLQICSFLAGLFGSKLIKNALIVAPAKVISHWREELHLVWLDDKFKGIVLTTYDCVRAKINSCCF